MTVFDTKRPAAQLSDGLNLDQGPAGLLARVTDVGQLRELMKARAVPEHASETPSSSEGRPGLGMNLRPSPTSDKSLATEPETARPLPGVSLAPGKDAEVRYSLPGVEQGQVIVPGSRWLDTASTQELTKLWKANHELLLKFATQNGESLPFIGAHGRTQEQIGELYDTQMGLDRSGRNITYVQTIARKASDVQQLLADLYQIVSTPIKYSDPTESRNPYTPGGIVVVDMVEHVTRDRQLGERLLGGVKGGGYIDSGPKLSPGNHAGETDISITPENFGKTVRGVISRDFIDRYHLSGDPDRASMVRFLRNQALLTEAFRIVGVASAHVTPEHTRSSPEGGSVYPGGSAGFQEAGPLVELQNRRAPLAQPVKIRNGPRGDTCFDITSGVPQFLKNQEPTPGSSVKQFEVARGTGNTTYNTPEINSDQNVSRQQARITVSNGGTMLIENGKADLSTPNYVGRLAENGDYTWTPVGRGGATVEPGESALIAGRYLIRNTALTEPSP